MKDVFFVKELEIIAPNVSNHIYNHLIVCKTGKNFLIKAKVKDCIVNIFFFHNIGI